MRRERRLRTDADSQRAQCAGQSHHSILRCSKEPPAGRSPAETSRTPWARTQLRTEPVPAPGSPGSRLPWGCPRRRCRAQGTRSVTTPMGPSGARAAGARAGEARGARRRRRRRRRRHRGERSLGTERAHCGRARALTARIPARGSAGAAGGSGRAQRPASRVRRPGGAGVRGAGWATAGAASDRPGAEGGAAGGDEVMPSEKAPDVTCSQSEWAARGQVTSAERALGAEPWRQPWVFLPPPSVPCTPRSSGTGS